MINPNKERLKFLTDILRKELHHLEFSASRILAAQFDLDKAQNIESLPELGETLEAFTSRFSRVQDTLGDKLLPAWLKAVGEQQGTALDNLDKAEKFGLLESSDEWMELRYLRNQMVHEYLDTALQKVEAINACIGGMNLLKSFTNNLLKDIDQRGLTR